MYGEILIFCFKIVAENTEEFSFLIPVMKALLDKSEAVLGLTVNVPDLPSLASGPDFFQEFQTYSTNKQWRSFIGKRVSGFDLNFYYAANMGDFCVIHLMNIFVILRIFFFTYLILDNLFRAKLKPKLTTLENWLVFIAYLYFCSSYFGFVNVNSYPFVFSFGYYSNMCFFLFPNKNLSLKLS